MSKGRQITKTTKLRENTIIRGKRKFIPRKLNSNDPIEQVRSVFFSLKIPLSNKSPEKISHKWRKKMTFIQFIKLLKIAVRIIHKNWEEPLRNYFFSLFQGRKKKYLSFIKTSKEPLLSLQMDALLTTMINKHYEPTLMNILLLKNKNVLPFQEFQLEVNEKHFSIDIDYIKSITKSDAVVDAYYQMLCIQNFLGDINESKQIIKNAIDNIFSYINFYFVNLNNNLDGITNFRGMTFITRDYYDNIINNVYSLQYTAWIIITIIHELSHHLIRELQQSSNFYLKTERTNQCPIKYNLDKKESGNIVEHFLFDNSQELFYQDSLYIITLKNYSNKTSSSFKKSFIRFQDNSRKSLLYGVKCKKNGGLRRCGFLHHIDSNCLDFS